MIIKRTSACSGKVRTKDIPVDPHDWALYEAGVVSIHDVMPYLTDEDREFILSGIVAGEWDAAFKEQIETDTFV